MPLPRLLPALAALAVLAACDRPVLDAEPPTVSVVAPDLSRVQPGGELRVRVRAVALRGVREVRVDGVEAAPVGDDLWEAAVTVPAGVSRLLVTAQSQDGAEESATAFVAVAAFVGGAETFGLPAPRAGHAAAVLGDGGVLLSGGSGGDGRALATAVRLREQGLGVVVADEIALPRARTGHAAVPLPDGRVLLIGGAEGPFFEEDPFVAEVDAVAPDGSVETLATDGAPVLRAGHVAFAFEREGRTFVAVVGGQRAGTPRPTTPGTIAVVEVRPDGVVETVTPDGGVGPFVAVPRGAGAVVAAGGGATAALVTGLTPAGAGVDPAAARVAAAEPTNALFPFDLLQETVGRPREPRTAAAAAPFGDPGEGLALLTGGQNAGGAALASVELYGDAARAFFAFPLDAALRTPRAGHTATRLPSGRILVAGGRDESGAVLSSYELLYPQSAP